MGGTPRKQAGVRRRTPRDALTVSCPAQSQPTTPTVIAERFKVALAAAPIVVFNHDCDLRYTWIGNPSLGIRAEDAIGRTDEEMLGAEAARPLMAVKRRVLETGRGERQEVSVVRLGQTGSYDLVVEPLRDDSGRITGLTCVAVDITERKRLEDTLRESEERFRSVVEDQTEVISRFRPDGTIIFANELFCRIFGKPREAILGHQWQPRVVAEDVPLVEARLRMLAPASPVVMIENRVHAANGAVRWMQFVNRAFFDAQGRLAEIQSVGRDITERKRAEEALRESEQRFATVVHRSPLAVGISRLADGEFLEVNDAFVELYGYRREEIIGHTAEELGLWHTGNRAAVVRNLRNHAGPQIVELQARRKGGELRELLASIDSIQLGGELCMVGFLSDITERKRAELALQASEERFRLVIENSQDGINLLDLRTGRYVMVSPVQVAMTGFTREELSNLSAEEAIQRVHPDDRQLSFEQQKQVAEGGAAHVTIEYRWKVKSGEYRWFSDSRSVIRNTQGKAIALVGVSRDITERKRLEVERTVTLTRLAEVEEQERLRLSRDLHDQIAQRLVALAVELKNLETTLSAGRSPVAQVKLLRNEVDDLQQQVHQIAWDLRTGESVQGGLEHGLREYVEEWSDRVGVPADYECRGLGRSRLPALFEGTLYRLAQEALANVEKHARARHVSVLLERADALVRLTVEDDGCGFDVEAAKGTSEVGRRLGLLGMEERVALAGGTLIIESTPGSGTTILVRIPISNGAEP